MFDLIQNSTFIDNVNKGITIPPRGAYFGATTGEGMAYAKDAFKGIKKSMGPDTSVFTDMTYNQSNYINPNRKKA